MQDGGGKKPLVATKSSMFNMPRNSRTPNVFTTSPRPGGYLQSVVSPNSFNQASINTALGIRYSPPRPSDRSRLIEGFQSLDQWVEGHRSGNPCDEDRSTSRSRSKDALGPDVSAQQVEAWPTGRKGLTENCNYVMAIAMSTVMALAANPATKPPDHHLSWTVNFLNSIKDDENKSPLNIQGIKGVIKPFLDDVPQSFLLPDDSVDQTLELQKTPPLDASREGRPVTSTPKSPKSKEPTLSPSQQSNASGAIPKNKGGRSPSFESGSRSPPRKSSWK